MKLPFGSWHGKCFQCLSFLETLSPVKVLSFPTPRFLNGGCSRARTVPAPRADKRSAAAAPMHAGGSGPCGIADGARAIHRRSWPGTRDHGALAGQPFPTKEPPQPFPHPRALGLVSAAALDHVSRSNCNSTKPSQTLLQPSQI